MSAVAGRIGEKRLPEPPAGMSVDASRLWTETVGTFEFGKTELPLLASALRMFDRAEQARAMIERDGPTWVTAKTGAIHRHPAVQIEVEARREFRIAWRTLGLVDPEGKQ